MAARNGCLYRLMCVLLLGVYALGGTVSAATYSGNCGADGDNLTWSLNTSTGVLTISGTGEMASYYGTGTPRPWESYIASIKSVILPEGITAIGTWAFRNHTSLATVNLPSTLTNIGSQAFCATAITSVEIPSSLTGINHWAFKDCASLTTVRLPASIANLPTPGAFCGCTSLQEVYVLWETADKIPTCSNSSNFFHDLSTKPKLYVPCGTTSLYQNKGWTSKFTLTEVVANGTCGANGDNLTWSLNTCGVLTISGTGAMVDFESEANAPWYSERESILSISIATGATSIGNRAFCRCTNLLSVTMPNSVTTIGGRAFYRCYALNSVTMSNLLVSIYSEAFHHCASLTSITIPSSVTRIDWASFFNCDALTDIFVSWTENIPNWADITNKNPQSDITLHVPCNAIGLYEKTSGWKHYTLQPVYTSSGTCGANGNNLTYILCDSVLTISGTGAMMDWETEADVPWNSYRGDIKSISLPEGLTNIGRCAFCSCDNLMQVIIPSGVTSIGRAAFSGNQNLSSVTIPNTVTSIGMNAFGSNRSLLSLIIPSSVTAIGTHAFSRFLQDLYVSWTGTDILTYTDQFVTQASGIKLHIPCGTTQGYTDKGWNAKCTFLAELPNTVSGTCGEGVSWELRACDSILTISGEGELAEYAVGEEPWHEYADLIDTIYVPCGKKAYYQSALPDYAERIGYNWCDQYVIDFVNWDGELLQSSLVDRETMPSYNGTMPLRETDELYKYTFIGWTPKVELATDDATYTATYLQRDKFEAIEDVESGESRVKSQKIIREGVLYIRRGEKIYTVLGTETE